MPLQASYTDPSPVPWKAWSQKGTFLITQDVRSEASERSEKLEIYFFLFQMSIELIFNTKYIF